jgi:hypothetical protein
MIMLLILLIQHMLCSKKLNLVHDTFDVELHKADALQIVDRQLEQISASDRVLEEKLPVNR